jgi:hypothetical protein
MSLAINKILVAGANANSDGAYFQASTVTVPNASSYVLQAGTYYVYPTANVVVQVNNSSAGNAFANVIANNTGGLIIADGVNVRLTDIGSAGNVNVSVVTINGGEAAGSTYA